MNWIMVALGGALGASARYGLSCIDFKTGNWPAATFISNIAGAFLIGIVIALAAHTQINPHWVLLWRVGVCGGFTTFSSFSAETLSLIENHRILTASAYICASVVICLVMVRLGQTLATAAIQHL